MKPLFWNSENYEKPSGAKATGGFPFDNGFGFEEWNNNAGNRIELDGVRHRVLHITSLNPEIQDDDNVVVFFIASHEGVQYLLGIISSASRINTRSEQLRIAVALKTKDRWREAWKLTSVSRIFKNEDALRKFWAGLLYGDFNWKCPEEDFIWFRAKRPISAEAVTGKNNFQRRFNAYQELDAEEVRRLLASAGLEGTPWDGDGSTLVRDLRVRLLTNSKALQEDLADIEGDQHLSPSDLKALADAKLSAEEGERRYRTSLVAERDPALSATAKRLNAGRNNGRITCDACRFSDASGGLFDAHHTNPISVGPRKTVVSDLAVLCPTCHRIAHVRGDKMLPLSVPEVRALRKSNAFSQDA